jgi:hypothetical protein
MLVKAAELKFATGAADAAARPSLPPHAVSIEAVARPPSGSIGAPTMSFRALRREKSSGSAMLS